MSEYSEIEEKINVYSHVLGVILGFIALFLLIMKSLDSYNLQSQISYILYGLSIIILYFSSARYHSAKDPEVRFKRKIIDHSAIYILIAGTYTPYALGVLGGKLGWIIFGTSWSMAAIGIALKVYFTGKFKVISTLMYVLMGWIVLFFIKPLKIALPADGFDWLFYGGLSYTLGALIYLIKKIKLNHGIFHLFVLIGSICHFISIYLYS